MMLLIDQNIVLMPFVLIISIFFQLGANKHTANAFSGSHHKPISRRNKANINSRLRIWRGNSFEMV